MYQHQIGNRDKTENLKIIKERKNYFAQDIFDMPGIDPEVITDKLNVDLEFKPIKQRIRNFFLERDQIINEEVKRVENNGLIREVSTPTSSPTSWQ